MKINKNCGIFVMKTYYGMLVWFYFKDSFIKIMKNEIYINKTSQKFNRNYAGLSISNMKDWKAYSLF